MAARLSSRNTKHVARRRQGRKDRASNRAARIPIPERLYEAIEAQRGNLAKADSLLGCLAVSLEYGPDPMTGPYHSDVAELARDLVRKVFNGLDSLTLQSLLERNEVEDETSQPASPRTRPDGPSASLGKHFPQAQTERANN